MVLVRCCEAAIKPPVMPPCRSPPPVLDPEASLGQVDDYVGIAPHLLRKTARDAPPWQKRDGPLTGECGAAHPWHRDQGKQRVQLRKGPVCGKSFGAMHSENARSSGASHEEFTAKGRWSGKKGGGFAARLVKRSTDVKKHPSRIPPTPPPPPRPSIPSYDSSIPKGAQRSRTRPMCHLAHDNHPIGEKRTVRPKQRAVITRNQDVGRSVQTSRW